MIYIRVWTTFFTWSLTDTMQQLWLKNLKLGERNKKSDRGKRLLIEMHPLRISKLIRHALTILRVYPTYSGCKYVHICTNMYIFMHFQTDAQKQQLFQIVWAGRAVPQSRCRRRARQRGKYSSQPGKPTGCSVPAQTFLSYVTRAGRKYGAPVLLYWTE